MLTRAPGEVARATHQRHRYGLRARNSTATTRQPTALRSTGKPRHKPHTVVRNSRRTHSRAQSAPKANFAPRGIYIKCCVRML